MGAAAYRRGSRAISRQIDRELAERRQICGGTYRSGPDKAYGYCDRCGRIDYEKYEGDKCTMPPKGAWPRDNPAWARVFENPKGKLVPAESLRVGDVIFYHDYEVEIVSPSFPKKDIFGRAMIGYMARVASSKTGWDPLPIGTEGEITFGPTGGITRLLRRARRKK